MNKGHQIFPQNIWKCLVYPVEPGPFMPFCRIIQWMIPSYLQAKEDEKNITNQD